MATILTISKDRQAKLSTFRVKINRAIAAGKFSPEVAAELTGISSDAELSEQAIAEITAMPKKAKGQAKPVGPSVDELQEEVTTLKAQLDSCNNTIENSDLAIMQFRYEIDGLTHELVQKTDALAACEKECDDLQSAFSTIQAACNDRLKHITRIEAMHKDRMAEVANILLARTQENERLTSELQTLQSDLSARTAELFILQGQEAKRKADIGKAILQNPNVRFAAAGVAIVGQAFLFALLFCKVYNIELTYLHITPLVIVGVLFEAVGLMIALSTDNKKGFTVSGDFVSYRGCWLTSFFLLQILIDFTYVGMFPAAASEWIGKVLIGISLPMMVLAYNTLYLKE